VRTVGRHWDGRPRNDVLSNCSYCGVLYPRSKLRRDRAGLLACPKDRGGDVVTLSEGNAQAAQRYGHKPPHPDPGQYDIDATDTPPTPPWGPDEPTFE